MLDLEDAKDDVTLPAVEPGLRRGRGNAKPLVEGMPGWWLYKIVIESAHHTSIRDIERAIGAGSIYLLFHGTRAVRKPDDLFQKLAAERPDTWELYGANFIESVERHGGLMTEKSRPRVRSKPKMREIALACERAGEIISELTNGDFTAVTKNMDGDIGEAATWRKMADGDASVSPRTYITALHQVRAQNRLHINNKPLYRAVNKLVEEFVAVEKAASKASPGKSAKPALVCRPKPPSLLVELLGGYTPSGG